MFASWPRAGETKRGRLERGWRGETRMGWVPPPTAPWRESALGEGQGINQSRWCIFETDTIDVPPWCYVYLRCLFPFYFRESVGVILIFLNKYDRVLKMLCEMVRWCVSIECWLNCDVFYFLDVICYVNAWLCIFIL